MAEPDLSKFAAAVRLRDRCTAAAVAHHERAGLAPSSQYARATYDAIAELVREDERRRLAALIDDLTDPDPCEYDHHGYCQAHGWMETDPRCPHSRAKDVLAEGGEPNAG